MAVSGSFAEVVEGVGVVVGVESKAGSWCLDIRLDGREDLLGLFVVFEVLELLDARIVCVSHVGHKDRRNGV